MVEEIVSAGLEGVGVEEPAAPWNFEAQLVFFIAFAAEWNEAGVAGLREGESGAGDAGERRRLVEVAVEAAQDPAEFGNLHGRADARIDGVLGDSGLEVGLALAADEREPGGGVVVVLDEGFFYATVDLGGLGEVRGGAVVEDRSEKVVLVLAVAVEACLECIACDGGGEVDRKS